MGLAGVTQALKGWIAAWVSPAVLVVLFVFMCGAAWGGAQLIWSASEIVTTSKSMQKTVEDFRASVAQVPLMEDHLARVDRRLDTQRTINDAQTNSINSVNSDISGVKSDISGMKTDISGIKGRLDMFDRPLPQGGHR